MPVSWRAVGDCGEMWRGVVSCGGLLKGVETAAKQTLGSLQRKRATAVSKTGAGLRLRARSDSPNRS